MRKYSDALEAVLGQYRGAGDHGDVMEEPAAPVRSLPTSGLEDFLREIPEALRPVLGQYAGAAECNNSVPADRACQLEEFADTKF